MILERIREENRILKREGRKEGRIEGRRKEKQTVARRMKKENLDIVLIKNVTGLSREEIEKL